MSNDVQRSFFIKLVAFSLGMGAVGHFVVGPKVIEAADLNSQHKMQTNTIARGEQEILEQATQVAMAKESMQSVCDQILRDLMIDDSLQSHQIIQRSAVSNGLTVTRVEPLQAVFSEVKTGEPEQLAKLEEKIFRIECHGSFSGVVAFIEELQDGPGLASVSSFRMVPTADQAVSVMMSVKLIDLIEVPGQLKQMQSSTGSSIASPDSQGDES